MFSIVVIFILPAADLALFGQKARPLPTHREPFRVPLKWRSAELRGCVGIAANSQPASSPRRTIRGMASVCVWGMILHSRTHVMQPCASFSAVECIRPILHVRFLVQILGQFSSYIFGFTTFKNIISSNLLLTRFRLIVWCVFKSVFLIYFFAWICLTKIVRICQFQLFEMKLKEKKKEKNEDEKEETEIEW